MGTLRYVMRVDAPVDRAFRIFGDLESVCAHFPTLFPKVERAEDSRFRVTYRNLIGRHHELIVAWTESIDDRMLGFKVIEGAVPLHGSISFEEAAHRTFLTLVLSYSPPGVRIGAAIGELLQYPHHRLREGLSSLLHAIETP